MSSILDALNKLEEEKAARLAVAGPSTPPAAPEEAAAALIGRPISSKDGAGRSFPWIPVALALFLGMAVTGAIVTATLLYAGRGNDVTAAVPSLDRLPEMHTYSVPVQADATPALDQEPTPVDAAPPVKTVEAPAPKPTPSVASETPATSSAVPTPPAQTAPPSVAPPVAPPSPPPPVVREVPASSEEANLSYPLPSTFTETPPTVPRTAPAAALPPVRPPEPRRDASAVDVDALPRLSNADRARYGLNDLRLNVLRESSNDQPEALAIINLKKVYVGEMIPGTRARLIGVKGTGIGIELEESRERFRIAR